MKKMTIFSATAVRYLKPRLFAPFSAFELTEALKERYHFAEVPPPRELARCTGRSPMRFYWGKMEASNRLIRIEQFRVTYAGNRTTALAASTRTSTEDADAFLDDLVEWGKQRYGIDSETVFGPTYRSLLEVSFERSIGGAFEELRQLGRTITHLVQGYGFSDCPLFEPGEISLKAGASSPEGAPVPVKFFLERSGAAGKDNRYLAQAPLRTHDHEKLLNELETLLSGRGSVGVTLMAE